MKTSQKPDLLIVLTTCVALGVGFSMYSQRARYLQIAPNSDQPSYITTIKQATPRESHPLDPSILVKVNETLQNKQQQEDKRPIEHSQPKIYQF